MDYIVKGIEFAIAHLSTEEDHLSTKYDPYQYYYLLCWCACPDCHGRWLEEGWSTKCHLCGRVGADFKRITCDKSARVTSFSIHLGSNGLEPLSRAREWSVGKLRRTLRLMAECDLFHCSHKDTCPLAQMMEDIKAKADEAFEYRTKPVHLPKKLRMWKKKP